MRNSFELQRGMAAGAALTLALHFPALPVRAELRPRRLSKDQMSWHR
jgi:hypothetical protein